MGYNISELDINQINEMFVDKIADYRYLLENVIDSDDCSKRFNLVARGIGTLLTNYRTLKSLIVEGKGNDRDNESLIQLENYIQSLSNDELEFLKFMTSSLTGNSQNYGLRFQNENGEVLFDNINKSISHSVISTLAGVKKRIGKVFEYPKEFQIRLDNPIQYIISFDKAAVDLPELFGEDLYKCFFTGDGEDFYYLMTKYFSEDEIRLLDKSVSMENDNYHDIYQSLIDEAKNKKIQKHNSIA